MSTAVADHRLAVAITSVIDIPMNFDSDYFKRAGGMVDLCGVEGAPAARGWGASPAPRPYATPSRLPRLVTGL